MKIKKSNACLVAFYWLQDLEVDPNKTVKNPQKKISLLEMPLNITACTRTATGTQSHTVLTPQCGGILTSNVSICWLSGQSFHQRMFFEASVSLKRDRGPQPGRRKPTSAIFDSIIWRSPQLVDLRGFEAPLNSFFWWLIFYFFNQTRFQIWFFFDFQKYLRSKTTSKIHKYYMYSLKWARWH